MKPVSLDLDRAPLLRLDEHASAIAIQGQGGGDRHRHARHIVRHVVALRQERRLCSGIAAVAGRQPSQCQGGAHQPQQGAAVDLRGLHDVGELGVDVAAHLRNIREFLQATPETRPLLGCEPSPQGFEIDYRTLAHPTYRWHVLQLVSRREASR